ncbi:MAG TPA: hypothetical protein VFR78_10150 [Pyrinomonadaceae bacterium]|nr:hypothetical protein [Pyrinomonadaceae bacterium]
MHTQENHQAENYASEPHNQQACREYDPQDFSQQAINRGQRQINFALTVVDEKLARALEVLRDTLAKTPGLARINFDVVDEAISDVYNTSRKVADIKPPGCDPMWY